MFNIKSSGDARLPFDPHPEKGNNQNEMVGFRRTL